MWVPAFGATKKTSAKRTHAHVRVQTCKRYVGSLCPKSLIKFELVVAAAAVAAAAILMVIVVAVAVVATTTMSMAYDAFLRYLAIKVIIAIIVIIVNQRLSMCQYDRLSVSQWVGRTSHLWTV